MILIKKAIFAAIFFFSCLENQVNAGLHYNPDRKRDLVTITNAMIELYHYVFIPETLPANVTEEMVDTFLDTCATEYIEVNKLREIPLNTVHEAVHFVTEEAYKKKDKLIKEEKAAEVAQIAASAATIAAAAFSWVPFLNVGLDAATLALIATSTGLEIAAEDFSGSVIDYISHMNEETIKQPNMEPIEKWYYAAKANGLFYPRLQIGMLTQGFRALMQSIPVGIKKLNINGGKVDASGYKEYIKLIGTAIRNGTTIVDRYETLMASIDNSTTPEELKKAKDQIGDTIPPELSYGFDAYFSFVSVTSMIRNGRALYKNRNSVVNEVLDVGEVDSEGNLVEDEGEGGEVGDETADAAGEGGWLETLSVIGKATNVLGGIAMGVMAGFEIKETDEVDEKLSNTIKKMSDALDNYYTTIYDNALQTPDVFVCRADSASFKFTLENGKIRGCDWLLQHKNDEIDLKRSVYCEKSAIERNCCKSCASTPGLDVRWNQSDGVEFTDVSTNKDGSEVWGVRADSSIFYKFISTPWLKVRGNLKQISVSGDGNHIWGVNSDDEIYYRPGPGGDWQPIDGRLADISVNEDGSEIWGVDAHGFIYRRVGMDWDRIAGNLRQISVNGDGNHVWGVSASGEIYYRNGPGDNWQTIDGTLEKISVNGNGNYVWGTNSTGNIFFKNVTNGIPGTSWQLVEGETLVDIAISGDDNHLWGVNKEGDVFYGAVEL